MAAYCVYDVVEIADPAAMEMYRRQVHKIVQRFGGRDLTAARRTGSVSFTFPVILEFDSMERAHAWYDSPEYREYRELRRRAARTDGAVVGGSVISGARHRN